MVASIAACGGNSKSNSDANGSGDGSNNKGSDGSGGPQTVMWTLTDEPGTPSNYSFVVAYQDGAGPWQLAPAPTGDTYSLSINSAVYAVAWTCVPPQKVGTGTQPAQARRVGIASFAVAERTTLTTQVPVECTDKLTPVALTGSVTNIPAGGVDTGTYLAQWGAGAPAAIKVTGTTGTFTIPALPGTHDLFIIHTPTAVGNGGAVADQVAVVRGVAVTGATSQDVDWSTAAASQSFDVTVTGAAAGSTTDAVTTLYAAGSVATLADSVSNGVTTTALKTVSLAAAQMLGTDVYDQSVVIAHQGSRETASNVTATPGAQNVTAPTALGGVTATVPTSTPYPEVKATWGAYASAVGYTWQATQALTGAACGTNIAACTITWTADVSNGVTGATPAWQMPDLSALTGWNAALQFAAGTQVAVDVVAETSSAGGADFPLATPPAVGTTRTFARSDTAVTP
ncbi:MAG TPA: hypothetical protein VLX92_18870 [Kofleriaceae bacterium]|nr:hypothetical protein [Kofleriaceae bacterium]